MYSHLARHIHIFVGSFLDPARYIRVPNLFQFILHVSKMVLIIYLLLTDGDEDDEEVVDDDTLSQPREEPASLEDLPSDQFDMPKRETSV